MKQVIIYSICLLFVLSCRHAVKDGSGTLMNGSMKIAYTKCGKGDTTLLFLHGWCINKEYWSNQLQYFCPRYTVVAIDLPGFGNSGKKRWYWNFDAYTEDVSAVIRELHLSHVILIGHSMSGDILLNADNKYPNLIDGIVGIDNLHEPGAPLTNEQQKETDQFFNILYSYFDSTVINYMLPALFQPSTDSSVIKRVTQSVYDADSSIAIPVLRTLSVISQEEKSLMKKLSHKLYLVNSDVQPINSDSLNKYCRKGFHAELVHGTGHYPMIEKPDAFNSALQKTIDLIGKK